LLSVVVEEGVFAGSGEVSVWLADLAGDTSSVPSELAVCGELGAVVRLVVVGWCPAEATPKMAAAITATAMSRFFIRYPYNTPFISAQCNLKRAVHHENWHSPRANSLEFTITMKHRQF